VISRENLLEQQLREKEVEIERLNSIINKIKSIIYNSFEYNALTKVALIRESLQGSDKEWNILMKKMQ